VDELLTRGTAQVRELVLNRPEAHNAITSTLLDALATEVTRAASDGVRVLVLHGGESRSFCAGADLHELADLDAEAAWTFNRGRRAAFDAIAGSAVPIIAAVHGAALGGGFELAMASTLVVAADDARFGLPEAGLGLIPGYGGTQRLPALIGSGPAKAMMLTGSPMPAAEADRLGLLATPPVPRAGLLAAADELASRICASAPLSVQLVLDAVRRSSPAPADLDHEAAAAAVAISSDEAKKRIAAFRARRTAR
jgi:enoyl-CoA hydratase